METMSSEPHASQRRGPMQSEEETSHGNVVEKSTKDTAVNADHDKDEVKDNFSFIPDEYMVPLKENGEASQNMPPRRDPSWSQTNHNHKTVVQSNVPSTTTTSRSKKSTKYQQQNEQQHRYHKETNKRNTATKHRPSPGRQPPSSPSLPTTTPAAAKEEPSFPDRLAASALHGTIELLKLAGGVTLSTTGKLVAPPLHMTRTVVLPNLVAAASDYFQQVTPESIQDWLVVLYKSIHHLVQVLFSTESGQILLNRLVIVISDLYDCITSEASRQVLIDWTATLVKFGQALTTPESKALLQQFTGLLLKVTQVISSGTTQLLLHDMATAVWAACELANDPATITALAEVTATLVHVLELEDATRQHEPNRRKRRRQMEQQQQDYDSSAAAQQQQRRQERNEYQRQQDRQQYAFRPEATVEQNIIHSLYGGDMDDHGAYHFFEEEEEEEDTDSDEEDHSVPSRIELSNPVQAHSAPTSPVGGPGHTTIATASTIDWDSTSIRQHLLQEEQEDAAGSGGNRIREWQERAKREIDSDYLRREIQQHSQAQRINSLSKQAQATRTLAMPDLEEILVETVEEETEEIYKCEGEDVCTLSERQSQCLPKRRAGVSLQQEDDSHTDDQKSFAPGSREVEEIRREQHEQQRDEQNPLPSPSEQFRRILQEILDMKREQSVASTIQKKEWILANQSKPGIVRRYPRQPQQQQQQQDGTIKQRLESMRAQLVHDQTAKQIATDEDHNIKPNSIESLLHRHGRFRVVVAIFVLWLILAWTAIGMYGMYVLVFGSTGRWFSSSPAATAPSSHEIIIRVVHYPNVESNQHAAAKSKFLWGGGGTAAAAAAAATTPTTIVTDAQAEKIASCVANAIG